jgi:hypothetical protein
VREQIEAPRSRRRRCENHPEVASVARCDRCGRRLCLACAIPFRGGVVGPECLPEVLPDAPVLVPAPLVTSRRWDVVAGAGFAFVLVLTAFPWSKFGEDSGALEAWRKHWSLLAAGPAAVGLVAAVTAVIRPRSSRLDAVLYSALALACGAGALLHYLNPPPLSENSLIPPVALIGPIAVLGVAGWKAVSVLRAGWAR